MSRDSFYCILDLIGDHSVFHNNSPKQQAVFVQLAVALDRFGHEGNGVCLDRSMLLWGISHGSMVNYTTRVMIALESCMGQEIVWPDRCRAMASSSSAGTSGGVGATGGVGAGTGATGAIGMARIASGAGVAGFGGGIGVGTSTASTSASTPPTTAPRVVPPPTDMISVLQSLATLIIAQPTGEMRSTKALESYVQKMGRFVGREVSQYLREYRCTMEMYLVSDTETIANFELVSEPELRDRIHEIARRYLIIPGCWESFERAMREEYLDEDSDRITRRNFWIG
ncbi:hypothetical protein R1sor_014288 [Riccia sorocarpa]|uniref:Uncharacterized protein n=1 Tax=Riccia sorocarpa TaxID=122646 RepID=A0ABD3HF35_9MARC